MKRAGIQRKTPMRQGAKGLRRGTPLKAGAKPLARTTELPKVNKERQARKTETAGMPKTTAKRRVRKRSGGWCEFRIPGACLGRATNMAHRKPEGQGGLYVPSNLVDSCGFGNNFPGCHKYQENNRPEAHKKGWLVHREDDHRKQPVWMWYRGVWDEWLLDDKGEAVPFVDRGEAA